MPKYRYLYLPDNWSAQQAWSVMEFIYQLEELVWNAYEEQLLTLVGPTEPDPPEPTGPEADSDLFLDDDIPF